MLLIALGCPKPIEPDLPPRSASQKAAFKPLPTKKPPPLPENLRAFQLKKLEEKRNEQKPRIPDFERNEYLRQRQERADMLLLTAESELDQGRLQSAQQFCIQAQTQGAGIAAIGYRPHVCMQAVLAAQKDWTLMAQRFTEKQQLKESWAGYGQWVLMGARAYYHLGRESEAKRLLEQIKTRAEVASELKDLLKKLEK